MYSYNATYVPCVFCRTTIPSDQMAAHLAQCQQAMPSSIQAPYGSSQSVQYRRVVRVERKTCDDHQHDVQPNPPLFIRQPSSPNLYGVPQPAMPQPSFVSLPPTHTILPGPPIQLLTTPYPPPVMI